VQKSRRVTLATQVHYGRQIVQVFNKHRESLIFRCSKFSRVTWNCIGALYYHIGWVMGRSHQFSIVIPKKRL